MTIDELVWKPQSKNSAFIRKAEIPLGSYIAKIYVFELARDGSFHVDVGLGPVDPNGRHWKNLDELTLQCVLNELLAEVTA